MNSNDNKKFWLATVLAVAGVALLFVGMLVDPTGFISTSVIGGAGEIFITAGAILGIDVVYSNKLSQIVKDITTNTNNNNAQNTNK